MFDFDLDRVSVASARGLLVFLLQALLFSITLVMLMQESTKLILHSVSAYVTDVGNIRRAAAAVLYIASGMLAFYRETSLARAMASLNPIPMLVDISDSRIAGLYAEVRGCYSTRSFPLFVCSSPFETCTYECVIVFGAGYSGTLYVV